jgi:Gluconate 2-dehydrogenase subunit 3
VQPAEFQRQFVESLDYIDSQSQKQYGREFLAVSKQDQQDLLIPWAYPRSPDFWMEQQEKPDPGEQHFARLKSAIAAAFYGSEVGEKELGWQGEFTNGVYQGCEAESSSHT